ncbi:MAG: hypothetical protein KC496_19020 [Anaerolineae bacterium]|nr:hypothetical protein [Anaerolineae bacterium]
MKKSQKPTPPSRLRQTARYWIPLLILAVTAALIWAFVPRDSLPRVSISQLSESVQNGDVRSIVVVQDSRVEVEYWDGNRAIASKPEGEPLIPMLELSGDVYPFEYREIGGTTATDVLLAGLPLVLTLFGVFLAYAAYVYWSRPVRE